MERGSAWGHIILCIVYMIHVYVYTAGYDAPTCLCVGLFAFSPLLLPYSCQHPPSVPCPSHQDGTAGFSPWPPTHSFSLLKNLPNPLSVLGQFICLCAQAHSQGEFDQTPFFGGWTCFMSHPLLLLSLALLY